MQRMHTVLKLRWTGHVISLPDERLPKKLSFLLRITGGKAFSRLPEETLQRHPQTLSEGFRHTNRVLGTDCTGAIKVARSHQKRSSSLEERICEAERKHRERKANGPPADPMTMTCSTCNRQFSASWPVNAFLFHLRFLFSVMLKYSVAAPVAEWLRSLTSVLLIIRSSHRCGFAPRTGHEFICETSHVLLAGVSGGFSPGTPVFAPPTD